MTTGTANTSYTYKVSASKQKKGRRARVREATEHQIGVMRGGVTQWKTIKCFNSAAFAASFAAITKTKKTRARRTSALDGTG
jgi:hypothetical protein